MNRRRILLALVPVNVALAVFADNGWTRTAAVCGAVGCLLAYLAARPARAANVDPAGMPVGTVIERAGVTARKTRRSDRDPWPWFSDGVAYSDEWAARLLATDNDHTKQED
ncbi:hypothetical protein [Micromonospora sp. DT62]|uniref:hypothetical protein n=1 Tax=Micromonospora sp. DT62 TaxID=3416521 RepID=UPI003CF97A07